MTRSDIAHLPGWILLSYRYAIRFFYLHSNGSLIFFWRHASAPPEAAIRQSRYLRWYKIHNSFYYIWFRIPQTVSLPVPRNGELEATTAPSNPRVDSFLFFLFSELEDLADMGRGARTTCRPLIRPWIIAAVGNGAVRSPWARVRRLAPLGHESWVGF